MNLKRIIIIGVAIFALAFVARWIIQQRVSRAVLGTDMVYTIEPDGGAIAEQFNKVHFTTRDAERNFADLEQRSASLRTSASEKSTRDVLKTLSDRAGRTMTASDFSARLERTAEYGAEVVSFHWSAFAVLKGDSWQIDYSFADKITMNDHSALIILLPPGAQLLSADPAPTEQKDLRLTWCGPGSIPWPRVEYRLP